MAPRPRRTNLAWLDLETTGIDVESCVILEIATIVTDKDLEVLAEGPSRVIHQPERVLGRAEEWAAKQHARSGLLDEVRASRVTLAQAEEETLEFLKQYCVRQQAPLCGNSICFDRRFLIAHMPDLDAFLSYRNVDVSSITELVSRWYSGEKVIDDKVSRHRALDDIRESIEELRAYRRTVFRE
jgi:oligoribonuclease